MTDTLALMAAGFMHAISPINLLAMLASTIVGITIGCLPGLSAAMGVALLLPVTFGMDPATGLIVLGGIYCGAIFGGAFMSMYYAAGWSLDMVAGRGFIALAAQAMGGGECLGGMLSSLVFGFAQALGIKFSAVGLDSNLASPIPYAVTIIGLVIFSLVRRSRAKKLHSAAALK